MTSGIKIVSRSSSLFKAGLKARSFVDVIVWFDAPLVEIIQSQRLGRLSQSDIVGLINKLSEYNN